MSGNGVRFISKHPDMAVDVCGVDNHEIKSIPLVTTGGATLTTSGEVILIMYQHECHRKNKTIHSSPKIEVYKNKSDYRSMKVGSGQHATTLNKTRFMFP